MKHYLGTDLEDGLKNSFQGFPDTFRTMIVVAAKDGYGELDKDALMNVPREEFPDDFPIEEGVELEIMDEEDNIVLVTIIEVGEETIKLDTNHPLAGKELNFDVKVLSLREPTAEELEHGHVHIEGQIIGNG